MLRSAFDPLPRSLSNTGLGLLVAVVLFGTGVTVYRYLESSEISEHRAIAQQGGASTSRPNEVRAASSDGAPVRQTWTVTVEESMPTCGAKAECGANPAPHSAPATLFRPDAPTSGS